VSAIPYRADIDGLRAVAVSAVMLFHAGATFAPGGFIGVDVFFVISGYLITSIILAELKQGTFSIWNFYERRIRRLVPALTLVIVTSAILGWFILTPDDYNNFGSSVIAAAAFYSNFHFHSQSGYFAPEAETLPLLHTWSLGVEEQFYLLAPAFILLLNLPRLERLRAPIFFSLLVASFTVSVYGAAGEHKSAFYLLPSRAFELMIGMALAIGLVPPLKSDNLRQLTGIVGLTMICLGTLFYTAETPFPGFAALTPCLGAALLIHSGCQGDTISSKLLGARPVVFIGKLSYALYLWHWPLLAFATYELGEGLSFFQKVTLLIAAFVLSILTYYFVEQPIRRKAILTTRFSAYAAGMTSFSFCVIFAAIVLVTHGVPQRLSPEASKVARLLPEISDKNTPCAAKSSHGECLIGDGTTASASFAFWGDSHARALSRAASQVAQKHGLVGYAIFAPGCPPVLEPSRLVSSRKKCPRLPRVLNPGASAQPLRNVIIAARWGGYSRSSPEELDTALQDTVRHIRRLGSTVTIIGPVPELPFDLPRAVMKTLMRGEERDLSVPFDEFRAQQAATFHILAKLEKLDGVRVLYPHLLLCDTKRCLTVKDGVPLYRDDNHLNLRGAELLSGLLDSALSVSSPQQGLPEHQAYP